MACKSQTPFGYNKCLQIMGHFLFLKHWKTKKKIDELKCKTKLMMQNEENKVAEYVAFWDFMCVCDLISMEIYFSDFSLIKMNSK